MVRACPKRTVRHLKIEKEIERMRDEPGVCLGVIGLASEPEERAVKQDGRDDERLILEDFFFFVVHVCVCGMAWMCDVTWITDIYDR